MTPPLLLVARQCGPENPKNVIVLHIRNTPTLGVIHSHRLRFDHTVLENSLVPWAASEIRSEIEFRMRLWGRTTLAAFFVVFFSRGLVVDVVACGVESSGCYQNRATKCLFESRSGTFLGVNDALTFQLF